MRSRREPLMIFGSARSAGVMPRMIACSRSSCLSSTCASASFICPVGAGQHAEDVADRAHLADGQHLLEEVLQREARRCRSWRRPWLGLLLRRSACSACSMRVSRSPMPRMREAIRSGWKTSKSASFSPLDANRIGWPVTSRTDSAAPPRASPSSLVSTTPVKPTPSRNASAVATASWPIIASTTNRVSSGGTASRMSAACRISSASTPSRPAVSTMTTS